MEEQLSLFDLVLNASLTVQFVMLLLLLASVVSWYMIAHRLIYFSAVHREMLRFEAQFWSGIDLAKLYRDRTERLSDGDTFIGMESIFRAGFKEFSRLVQQADLESESVL